MNSEDTLRINRFKTPQQRYQEELKDKQDRDDTKTLTEGDVMIAFMAHPGWILLKRELEAITNELLRKLVDCHGTIREREALQINIKMLQKFAASPNKYVDDLKRLHARKIKR